MYENRIIACLTGTVPGDEEHLWCEVAGDVKNAMRKGESNTIYIGILDNDSKQDPEMTRGTFVTLTMRGWKAPLISSFC